MITKEDIITLYDNTAREMSESEKAIRIMLLFGIELDQFQKELKKAFDDFINNNKQLQSKSIKVESGFKTIDLEMVLFSKDELNDIDKILKIFCEYLKIRCSAESTYNFLEYPKVFIHFAEILI